MYLTPDHAAALVADRRQAREAAARRHEVLRFLSHGVTLSSRLPAGRGDAVARDTVAGPTALPVHCCAAA